MSATPEELFKQMLELVEPHIKEERSSIVFEGEKSEDEWEVTVNYYAKSNGAKILVPEILELEEPFALLADFCDDKGKGDVSHCKLTLAPTGEVSAEMKYAKEEEFKEETA